MHIDDGKLIPDIPFKRILAPVVRRLAPEVYGKRISKALEDGDGFVTTDMQPGPVTYEATQQIATHYGLEMTDACKVRDKLLEEKRQQEAKWLKEIDELNRRK